MPRGRCHGPFCMLKVSPGASKPAMKWGGLARAAGLRHLQGTHRLARLPDARTASGPDHPRLFEPRCNRPRPLRRPRHDLDSRQETGTPLPRLRALSDFASAIEGHLPSAKVGQFLKGGAEPLAGGEGMGTIQESSSLTFDT